MLLGREDEERMDLGVEWLRKEGARIAHAVSLLGYFELLSSCVVSHFQADRSLNHAGSGIR